MLPLDGLPPINCSYEDHQISGGGGKLKTLVLYMALFLLGKVKLRTFSHIHG